MTAEKVLQWVGAAFALATVAVVVGSPKTAAVIGASGNALSVVIRAAVSPVTGR